MNYIKIVPCVNGWQTINRIDDDTVENLVYEGGEEDDKAKIEAFCRLLEDLVNNIGPSTNRYSKHRIQISVVQGDKTGG